MLVEIGVINAHSPFIILFPYKDRTSYPLWMIHFFNEASREEFSYFPFNCLMLVVSKSSKALTVLASRHEVLSIGHCSGPPETSSVCFPHQRSSSCMVAANALMYLLQYVVAIFFRDALHEDT
jgi:hypothetical protein